MDFEKCTELQANTGISYIINHTLTHAYVIFDSQGEVGVEENTKRLLRADSWNALVFLTFENDKQL